jgi:hypothetical protein
MAKLRARNWRIFFISGILVLIASFGGLGADDDVRVEVIS